MASSRNSQNSVGSQHRAPLAGSDGEMIESPLDDNENGGVLSRFIYRLNPYFLNNDRKVWVTISILLMALCYGLACHVLAMSAGFQAGSQIAYGIVIVALVTLPLWIHALAPRFTQGRQILLATLPANSETWTYDVAITSNDDMDISDRPPTLAELKELLKSLGLTPLQLCWVEILLQEIQEVSRQVWRHAAELAGRTPNDHRHHRIRLRITAESGSPYCHALAWGGFDIVFPVGSIPLKNTSATPSWENELRRNARYLLAHEMSHLFLRDEPLWLFADARLISVATALHSGGMALLGATFVTFLVGPRAAGTTSFLGSLWPPLAVLLGMLTLIISWWRHERLSRVNSEQTSGRRLLQRGLLAVILAIGGAIEARFGLTASGGALTLVEMWPRVYACLALVVGLGQLCVFLGRRQMEFIADETAINALGPRASNPAHDGAESGPSSRDEMYAVLEATYQSLLSSRSHLPAPKFAVGHSAGFMELQSGVDVMDEIFDDWSQIIDIRMKKLKQQRHSLLTSSLKIVRRGVRFLRDVWADWFLPLWRTHPRIAERKRVVRQPDLQVEQDPRLPLVYTTLGLITVPSLLASILGHLQASLTAGSSLLDRWVGGSFNALLTAAFLLLAYMVARRPVRTHATSKSSDELDIPVQPGEYGIYDSTTATTGPRARSDLALVNRAVELQLRQSVPSSLIDEVWRVAAALLVGGCLAALLLKLVEFLGGGTLGGLPVLGFNLPTLGVAELVGFSTASFLGLYLLAKFWSLAHWQFYPGIPVTKYLLLQCLNLLKALSLTAICVGVIVTTWLFAGQILALLWRSAALSGSGDPKVMVVLAGLLLQVGFFYALVICWWPSLPTEVRCPLGHPVQMHWHNPLWRPENDKGETWAWLHCPKDGCQRAPQAGVWLTADGDNRERMLSRSRSGWWLVLALVAVSVALPPLWVWGNGLLLIGVEGRCRTLATRAPISASDAFLDCTSHDTLSTFSVLGQSPGLIKERNALPTPPNEWRLLVMRNGSNETLSPPPSSDVARVNIKGSQTIDLSSELLWDEPGMENYLLLRREVRSLEELNKNLRNELSKYAERLQPSLPLKEQEVFKAKIADIQHLMSILDPKNLPASNLPPLSWNCGDYLSEVRNRVAYFQACAITQPDIPPMADQCINTYAQMNAPHACGCLWARGNKENRINQRHARILAAQKLYHLASLVLHASKEICSMGLMQDADMREKDTYRELWGRWHIHLETETTPRVLIALANGNSPDHFLDTSTQPTVLNARQNPHQALDLDKNLPPPINSECQQPLHADLISYTDDKLEPQLERRRTAMCRNGDKDILKPCVDTIRTLQTQGALCRNPSPINRQACRQFQDTIKACVPCLSAQGALEQMKGYSCQGIAEKLDETRCDASNEEPLCKILIEMRNDCQQRYKRLFGCLSADNLRRHAMETSSVVAILEAQQRVLQPAQQRITPDFAFFASVGPSFAAFGGAKSNIDKMVAVLRNHRANHPESCASAKQIQEEHLQYERLKSFGPKLVDGSVPKELEADFLARSRILVCELALEKEAEHQPTRAALFPTVDRWIAKLACEKVPDNELAVLNDNYRKLIIDGYNSPASARNPEIVRFCRSEGIQVTGPDHNPCETALALGDLDKLSERREQIRRILEEPFRALSLTKDGAQVGQSGARVLEINIRALRAGLVCQRTQPTLLDRALCLHYQTVVARDLEGQRTLAPQIARRLEILGRAPPLATPLVSEAEKISEEAKEALGSVDRLKICEHLPTTEQRLLGAWLASMSDRALLGQAQPLHWLARTVDQSDEVRRHFGSCLANSQEPMNIQDCATKMADLLQKVTAVNPVQLSQCLFYGATSFAIGQRLLRDDDLRTMLASCDWPYQWQRALFSAQTQLGQVGSGAPLAPHDAWELLVELKATMKRRRTQIASLPEYMNARFPEVPMAWSQHAE